MNSQYMKIADGATILERLRSMRAERKAVRSGPVIPEINAIDVLRAIVEEVSGAAFPFSADSYLPAHLIHDARQVIEQYEREQEASQ